MPSNIIVDCTWPCPGENDQACILSETSLNCQQKRNSQWVWTDPHLSPQYDGEPARLHRPCITVPSFQPSTTIYSSPNSTQSSVEWPPNDKYQPMDQYLSDCNPANYCEQGTCVPKFDPGQPCVSTNQCLSGICNSETNTCQKDSSSPPSQQQQHQQENDHQQNDQTNTNGVTDGPWSKPTFTTSHLVGVVIAVIVLLAAILFFYFYRRRKRASRIVTSSTSDNNSGSNDNNKLNSFIPRSLHENVSSPILPLSHINNPSSSLQPPAPPSQSTQALQSFSTPPSSSSSSSPSSPSPPTNTAHVTLQSHPSTDINTTPSMQQQQLQFQLQRQHPSLSHGSSTSPPPYSP